MIAFSSIIKPNTRDINCLQQVWNNIDPQSCPLNYNFHLHTLCSDGKLTPLALIQQAIQIGLKGLAITDHHSVEGYYLAREWLERLDRYKSSLDLPHLWTGIEITSNLQGVEVHILGYGFTPDRPSLKPYIQGYAPKGKDAEASKVIDSIHQAGGLAVLAHPARYRRPARELIPLAASLGIDGVEAYYAYGNPKPWKPSPVQTEQVKQLASQYHLYTTCGTDSHGLNICQRI